MANREVPDGAFNFGVKFDGDETLFGGFSDVSGIGSEITIAEYRNGNEQENHVRKIAGVHKVSDVTLKRGIVNSKTLWDWIKEVRREGSQKAKNVSITLRDETGKDVQTWLLNHCVPMKYTGATLAGKGGGDVAMEELVLSAEAMEIEVAGA
jgi:phage tail-like protein